MPTRTIDRVIATPQTPDGNPVNIPLRTVTVNDTVGHVLVNVMAIHVATGDVMARMVTRGYKRFAGVTSVMGSSSGAISEVWSDGSGNIWTAFLIVSGNDVTLQITGEPGKTIEWFISAQFVDYVP